MWELLTWMTWFLRENRIHEDLICSKEHGLLFACLSQDQFYKYTGVVYHGSRVYRISDYSETVKVNTSCRGSTPWKSVADNVNPYQARINTSFLGIQHKYSLEDDKFEHLRTCRNPFFSFKCKHKHILNLNVCRKPVFSSYPAKAAYLQKKQKSSFKAEDSSWARTYWKLIILLKQREISYVSKRFPRDVQNW